MFLEDEETIDTSKLEEEVAKISDEDKDSVSTTEKTSEAEEAKEETSEEDSTRTDTSIKTEKEPDEEEETKVDEDDTRFDKHPRWQKLKQERDDAVDHARQLEEVEERLGDFSIEELTRLKNAGNFLRKYPELAEKVTELIDNYDYKGEEKDARVDEVIKRQENLELNLLLKEYDNKVDSLMKEHKINEEYQPLIKEVLESRVMRNKIKLENVPKAMEKLLKEFKSFERKTIASHIKDRSEEQEIPSTSKTREKVLVTKKESAEAEDVINELAEGLRATRGEIKE